MRSAVGYFLTTMFICLPPLAWGQSTQYYGASTPPQIASAQPPQGLRRGPPLEQYVHSLSENGRADVTVMYHANGTFDMITSSGGMTHHPEPNFLYAGNRTGTWEWRGEQFCVHVNGDSWHYAEDWCKNNGHLIGRAPAYY